MDGTTMLLMSIAGVFVGLLALLYAFFAPASPQRADVTRSLALIGTGYRRGGVPSPIQGSYFDRVVVPSLHRVAGLAERLSSQGHQDWLRRALDRAGNPPRWTVPRVLGAKAVAAVGLGVLGLFCGLNFGGAGLVLTAVTFGGAGLYLPDVLLYNAGLKRQDEIRKSLADGIDMLTVCVEAGLAFDAALSQVARGTDGALAREFLRVLQTLQLGTSRSEALLALGERTKVPELQAFVGALVQADGLGIPIANILREQAKELRTKRRQRAEEKAQKVPVKIVFPMLLFIFPALFVVVIGPGAIEAYRAFTGK
jgi:tight adherence protein C